MAQRILRFDWSATTLGDIGHWSRSLRAAVQLLLASPVPLVMLWGRPGHMIYNDAYAEFAGGRHPFLLGTPVELGWPEIASFNRHVVDTCLSGATLSFRDKELVLLRNGQPEDVSMDLYYSPVPEDDGRPAGVLAVVVETTRKVLAERDRTRAEDALVRLTQTLEQRVADAVAARVEAEEQLRQIQKMEAIGNLTGGVAHDFNNVLQVISGNLQLLAMTAGNEPAIKRRIAAANDAVQRGAKLSSQLLAFARRQPLMPTVVNPRGLFEKLTELLHRLLPETVAVRTELPERPWNLSVDPSQLDNALLNLAINSRDALAGDGTLVIAAENVTFAQPERIGNAVAPPGDYVCLVTSDDGAGMTPEVLDQAFEPFFTTKPEGHGTGLGLSMVFGFVNQSDGYIAICSTAGIGTTVRLYFPRCLEEEATEAQPKTTVSVGGGETVLIVEDNADVRLTAVDLLTQLGYKVLTAPDGDAALAILRSGVAVDLLFTDVVMPGKVKSDELARIARGLPGKTRVLFTSGYTRDIILHQGKLDPGVVLLSKPYRRDELARKVRSVLDAAP